jgi:hypothetical protein
LTPTMYFLMRSLMKGWLTQTLSSSVREAREKASYRLLLTDPQGLLLAFLWDDEDCKAVRELHGLPAEGPQEEDGSVAQPVGQGGHSCKSRLRGEIEIISLNYFIF